MEDISEMDEEEFFFEEETSFLEMTKTEGSTTEDLEADEWLEEEESIPVFVGDQISNAEQEHMSTQSLEEAGEDWNFQYPDMIPRGRRMEQEGEDIGMIIWEGECGEWYEDAEYDEKENQISGVQTPKDASTSLSTSASLPISSNERKKKEGIKVIKHKPKPCGRDRMRQWLNRDNNKAPEETFLGRPYSERDESMDYPQDPCKHIFFGERKMAVAEKTLREEQLKVSDEINERPKDPCMLQDPTKRSTYVCPCNKPVSQRDLVQEDQKGSEGTCPCKQCMADGGVAEMNEEGVDVHLQKKLRDLMTKWFLLKNKHCHCKKTGWMSKRSWPRHHKKKTCICKSLDKMRRKIFGKAREIRSEMSQKKIEAEEWRIRNEKIQRLLDKIGPVLAEEYKMLAQKHPPLKKEQPSDPFGRMINKEFGTQLRKYRLQNLRDGNMHREYDKNDTSSLQYVELPNGACYYGQFSQLGMEGKCIYQLANGPIFVGCMVDGRMEGQGRLIYPNGGVVEGTWVNGTLFDPKYTFSDGLKYKPDNWKYCRMPDRRFVSEIMNGMNSPENVQLSANHPARQIPKGCLDAEEGFYDPQKRVIIHPSSGKVIRIVSEHEGNWILQNCRRQWFEEVPFSRYMYENWYAGTIFPPPGDEPEWFDEEFAKVVLPYTNVEDVLAARKLVMDVVSGRASGNNINEAYLNISLPSGGIAVQPKPVV